MMFDGRWSAAPASRPSHGRTGAGALHATPRAGFQIVALDAPFGALVAGASLDDLETSRHVERLHAALMQYGLLVVTHADARMREALCAVLPYASVSPSASKVRVEARFEALSLGALRASFSPQLGAALAAARIQPDGPGPHEPLLVTHPRTGEPSLSAKLFDGWTRGRGAARLHASTSAWRAFDRLVACSSDTRLRVRLRVDQVLVWDRASCAVWPIDAEGDGRL